MRAILIIFRYSITTSKPAEAQLDTFSTLRLAVIGRRSDRRYIVILICDTWSSEDVCFVQSLKFRGLSWLTGEEHTQGNVLEYKKKNPPLYNINIDVNHEIQNIYTEINLYYS